MRLIFLIFLIVFVPVTFVAQDFSLKFNSISKEQIKQLPGKYKNKHDTILKQRLLSGILRRIDTTVCDYIFITEKFDYSDSSMYVSEEYYMENKDSARYFFEDNVLGNDGINDLRFIKKRFLGLKKQQHIPYSRIELREHDRWCQPVRKLKREIKAPLKATYGVMTMINKRKGTIKVSILHPVRRPFIFTIYVGGGKC